MKTIQQLLQLAKNPHYKLMPDEKRALDAFLAKQADEQSTRSQKRSSNRSSRKTPVTVRNVVQKVDTYAPEAHSSSPDESKD